MKDRSKPRRSMAKAMTWRIVSTLFNGGLAYAFFGQYQICLQLMAVDFLVKFVLFYYHERAWHQVPWGKIRDEVEA